MALFMGDSPAEIKSDSSANKDREKTETKSNLGLCQSLPVLS
jgi:hypothetical protein